MNILYSYSIYVGAQKLLWIRFLFFFKLRLKLYVYSITIYYMYIIYIACYLPLIILFSIKTKKHKKNRFVLSFYSLYISFPPYKENVNSSLHPAYTDFQPFLLYFHWIVCKCNERLIWKNNYHAFCHIYTLILLCIQLPS